MRLTLRTLLAYLDDTLEPAQAKLIGEKVAESDMAPELIERIKKVTRRRGLAAPPVTGDADDFSTDPNMVAEYLDNVLPSERLGEFEETVLGSDAHLAEVAASHQILTLLLGEPARVPPTARQRMYRLVKGHEAIPYRKPTPSSLVAGVAEPQEDHHSEDDETLLFGMSGRKLLGPLLTAAVVLILLVVVIWQAIPPDPEGSKQAFLLASNSRLADPDPKKVDKSKTNGDPVVKKTDKPKGDPVVKKPDDKPKGDPVVKKPDPDPTKKDPGVGKLTPELLPLPREVVSKPIVTPPDKADLERRPMARLQTRDVLLASRQRGSSTWSLVEPSTELHTSDTLMSLPGNRGEIKLSTGVNLLLWGSLPQFESIPVLDLQESRVVLHVPPVGYDADFTLESGRVFISRPVPKGQEGVSAKVKVRFRNEVWDVTLHNGDAEVCADLLGYYPEGVPFSKEKDGPAPKTEFYFALLKGKAGLRVKFKEYPNLQAPMRADWDSVSGATTSPVKIEPEQMTWWNRTLPQHEGAKQMQAAVSYFVEYVRKSKSNLETIFNSTMKSDREPINRRAFAVHCLQAMDSATFLADAIDLVDPPESMERNNMIVRTVAIRCLQHWTGLDPDRDLQFFKVLREEKGYTEAQATVVLQLLHPLSPEEARQPEFVLALFDALKHERIPARELAYMHLNTIDPAGAKKIGYFDVSAPDQFLEAITQKWKADYKNRVIDKKK